MKQLPENFLNSIADTRGFDREAFTDAHFNVSPTSIRIHPIKNAHTFPTSEPVPWCPQGIYLDKRPVFTLDPLLHAGAYYVQEASSMFLDYVFRTLIKGHKKLRILDLCAAPGGKSTLISSLIDDDSLLISNDVIRSRASILEENISRWGYMNNWVISNDPKDVGKLKSYFDIVVVDAPCSGSGLFRKDTEAISEWSLANVELCSQRQKRIIADIWPAIREGGILVYSTCSYSAEENEDILDWLADTFDVSTQTFDINNDWGILPVSSSQNAMAGYRFFPDKVKGEGFFIAAVRKDSSEEHLRQLKFKSANEKKLLAESNHLLSRHDIVCLPSHDIYSAISLQHEPDLQVLSQYVYLRKFGINLGAPMGKSWLPHHDLALSIDRSEKLPAIGLNKTQALAYLKKEELDIPIPDKGLYLATYMGLGLGWMKSLGNRINNYLPKNLRIRMDINLPE